MPKYLFTNIKTFPFRRQFFKGQPPRYAKCCIVSVDNPQKVLAIIPLFGFEHIVNDVYKYELGEEDYPAYLNKPICGDFIDVPSKHGPLFRVFTKDDAQYGLCSKEDIGKVERTITGKVRIYHSIKVFIHYDINPLTGERMMVHGWNTENWYYRFFGYNYFVLSDLTEPLQL